MRGVKLVFTDSDREIMAACYRREISVHQAAERLDVSANTVYSWMTRLGMRKTATRVSKAKGEERPDKSKLCSRCEILLRCAPRGTDGKCGYCLDEERELPEREYRNEQAFAHLKRCLALEQGQAEPELVA